MPWALLRCAHLRLLPSLQTVRRGSAIRTQVSAWMQLPGASQIPPVHTGRTEGGLRQAREARSCGPTSSSTNKLVGWPHQHLTPTSHLTRQSLLGLKNIPPCAISYFLGVITPLESQVIMTTPASPTPCINKPVLSPFSSKLVVRGNVHGGCS